MPKISAIILSGGNGKRMKMDIPKQYMDINGHPLIYYTIKAFEESRVDSIILVTGMDYIEYCRDEIVKKYNFVKVDKIVAGGAERYDSVYCGLMEAENCDYVLIHDGARACITEKVIEDSIINVMKYKTAVAAVPVKDTIKQASPDGYVTATFDRNTLWQIQTPQAFIRENIVMAYNRMYESAGTCGITDDAMVMEQFGCDRIKLFMSDYNNIKVTTAEDIPVISELLKKLKKIKKNVDKEKT